MAKIVKGEVKRNGIEEILTMPRETKLEEEKKHKINGDVIKNKEIGKRVNKR